MSEQCTGGLHEVCIGVPDFAPAIQYFERHGYRVGDIGELVDSDAEILYGVRSAVRAVRLHHQQADHGLIRLMNWDHPVSDGLGMNGFRVQGARWGAMLTRSVMNVMNHVEHGLKTGLPMRVVEPVLAVTYQGERVPRAFLEPLAGVREMALVQPHYRQIYFERFGFDRPGYGRIDDHCLLRTSQITHAGLVVQSDDARLLDFYEDAFGLFRSHDSEVPYAQATGARTIFELEEDETHHITDFDDPANRDRAWQRRSSGRLKIVRFGSASRLKDMRPHSRPGALGTFLYSWRCLDIEATHRRVQAAGASQIGDIIADEFGERAFTCTAPDGNGWMLIEG